MTCRMRNSRIVAASLIVSMYMLFLPVPAVAAENTAAITGQVTRSADSAPLPGAVVHISDQSGELVYSSSPTGSDGGFELSGLPASSYEVAVEADGGLYLVNSAISLTPGQNRTVHLSISPGANKGGAMSFMNNPATAALVIIGGAIVVGLAVDAINDDDEEVIASPFQPGS